MKSLSLCAACVAAVVVGAALVRSPDMWLLPSLVAAAFGLAIAVLFGNFTADSRTWAIAGLLVCAGLLRGATLGPSEAPRVRERGPSDGMVLRVFEVVGAGEPGPRCRLELRDPGQPQPTITVEAPTDSCPRSQGDRVALLAPSLGRRWQGELLGKDSLVLDRAPVLWTRPPSASRGLRGRFDPIARRYWAAVAELRWRAWSSTRGDDEASLVVAAGLGLRSALAPEPRDQLRAAGLGHLIAVSGLHVAVAALWLMLVIRRLASVLGLSPRWACVLTWVPLWAYVGLTGGAASAVRAATMLTLVDLGNVVGRPTHGPTSLVLAAAAMLLWQPGWLLDPGFALSMAAMAAIVTAPRELGMLAMSWRITWATAPLSLLLFDATPIHGLLGNAVALPLFAWMMPAALVASVAPGALGQWAMVVAKLFAAPILALAEGLAHVPSLGALSLLMLASAALLVHAWVRRRARTRPNPHDHRAPQRPWLPPSLACWLSVGVCLQLLLAPSWTVSPSSSTSATNHDFEWLVFGSSRSYSLIVANPSQAHSACLYRPTGGPSTVRSLLTLLGVTALARLDPDLPPKPTSLHPEPEARPQPQLHLAPPRHDPHAQALGEALTRAGIELTVDSPASCVPPSRTDLRALLRSCIFYQGNHGRVLARVRDGRAACRVDDRWVPVDSSG